MAALVRGDVVVVPFPFSDATGTKRRPALVLASVPFGSQHDYILCMITSRAGNDANAVEVAPDDVNGGGLARTSYIRPTYLFTIDEGAILRVVGRLGDRPLSTTMAALRALLA